MKLEIKENKIYFEGKDLSELFDLKEITIDTESNEAFIVASAKAKISDMKIDATLALMVDGFSDEDLLTLKQEIDFEMNERRVE